MAEVVGITLLGHGTVGRGVVRLLREQGELLFRRTGLRFELRHIVVRDRSRHPEELPCTTDAEAAIDDPQVRVVIELIGGIEAADRLIRRALSAGKPVVTANKSLLAARGPTLMQLARRHHTCIGFEASCGGGIPIIGALQRGLLANRIDALVGIVNGTCNLILTRMTGQGWTYARALAEAQQLGFAEADPTLDVSGADAAQKLAILAGLAFDSTIDPSSIYREGIDHLEPIDLRFAAELGYVVKLLAIAERTVEDRISLRVHPTLIHRQDVLADVNGSFNAISVYGHALGHALFYGRGAGAMPTASAVVSDLLAVTTGVLPAAFARLRFWSDEQDAARLQPIGDLRSRYYLRLLARDVPGTIAQITEVLGRHGISISAIMQREDNGGKFVPVVITTHIALEANVSAALREIDRLACILPTTVRLRILDPPTEASE
ncbi:MAG: homoserine dehydrogenase [Phycisphaerales bacterium]|nr:homoserine dehydrogenase [Phycisphaerales bacterium]